MPCPQCILPTAKNTGNIFPIFLALVVASIAWIFIDPELRRGLSSYTGIGYVPDVLEDLVTKEYTIKLHGSYLSTCSQRVLVVAKEKELDVDMHVVNTAAVRPEMRHIPSYRADADECFTEGTEDTRIPTELQPFWSNPSA